MPTSSASSRRAASSQASPAPTTPPTPTSHRPGQRSLSSLRRWTSSCPALDTTTMKTARWRRRSARICRRVTVATTRSCSSTTSTSSSAAIGWRWLRRERAPRPVPTMTPCLSTRPRCVRKPRISCPRPWPCAGRCTSGRRSATSCPSRRRPCCRRSRGCPLDVTVHETTSGIAALLTGERPGPTILLRGDMDALPLHEDTDLDFTSKSEGSMHACGHDTHTAMLAGAAKLLAGRRADIAGRVLFMFQPGEEGHHGARFMLEEGLLDVPDLADGTSSPVTGRVRPAHHVVAAVGLAELPAGFDHGVGRLAAHHDHRQGRPRQRAAPGDGPDPGGVRGRAGVAADGHALRRRVRPRGRDGRAHLGRHDEQHHPGDRPDRGHDPRRQREDPVQGPRRHPPRRRRRRRGPRLRGRGRGPARLPGHRQRRLVRRPRARHRRRARRHRQGRSASRTR